ncbi:ABC transporter permease [Gleimia sp. 6138-11-ORH1]|uniref:ABC transporter permease n=1 Tax=Gleimia sp. 6138-11-ORH1 TaxID=2973937 RepID=UPI0021684862|nr:ABC transporter permease [Gleimia sp. 6138-11-ORH1]MCS4485053.1 ABC transporter permease [Gleimia sp. 6138-11-ORH1]
MSKLHSDEAVSPKDTEMPGEGAAQSAPGSSSKGARRFSGFVFLGTLFEAWEELLVNRGRVILSLTGVAAAVWAMATVIALGGVISEAQDRTFARYSGQPGTVRVSVTKNSGEADEKDLGTADFPSAEVGPPPTQHSPEGAVETDENGQVVDVFGKASLRTVELLKSNYWSRYREVANGVIQAPGYMDCPVNENGVQDDCYNTTPFFKGIDPQYFEIFSLRLLRGRLLTERDATLQMNPVVISELAWEYMGKPDLRYYPRFRLQDNPNISFTVVGVVDNLTGYEGPTFYMNYETFMLGMPADFVGTNSSAELIIVAPKEQKQAAAQAMGASLQGLLGPQWQVNIVKEQFGENIDGLSGVVTVTVSVIGYIVISLGALGLLTVSIVTIRYRVREIGIRRAMGASAKRIFVSVFMESVVATTVAGIIGVIASIITIRSTPLLAWINIPFSTTNIGYPMSAALLGLSIAAGVGALAGIIPATIAVRIKPIDAIRF